MAERARRLALAWSLVMAPAAAAGRAQNDQIAWGDGTTTAGCRVVEYSVQEVRFEVRGQKETRSADRVQGLTVERAAAAFAKAKTAADVLAEAERRHAGNDPLVAQLAWIEAARRSFAAGARAEAFAALQRLVEAAPQAGCVPWAWRLRLEHLRTSAEPQKEEFARLAQGFARSATTRGWPAGFAL